MRVTLAAGTATGAGTAVALPAAMCGLLLSGADVTAIVPVDSITPPPDPRLVVRAVSRTGALWREAIGVRPGPHRADVYIGFCDRLPLLRRGGSFEVLVVQNPHLYASSDVATSAAELIKFATLGWWARRSVRRADRVICSTSASRSEVAVAAGIDPMAIEVIPIPATGISIDGIGVTKTDHRDQIERILIVGDLYGYKCTDVAVRAVAQFAAARPGRPETLTHIGRDRDAPAACRFEAALDEASSCGVRVVRLGVVAHDRVIEEMVAADVIVLASSIETQGLPLVEAMAVGLPVVARAIGPFVELGGDAFESVRVAGDATDFAAAIGSIDEQSDRELSALAGRALHPPGDSWRLLLPPT